jgi:AcrR family transcriptional regulator
MTRAQFDRNEVIDKSIQLFWKHGFSGSSIQQVVDATGLKPGSIYFSFGNKETLFREVLERYAEKSIAQIRNTLDRAHSVGEGICTHLEKIVQEAAKENYTSCLLVKTQLELAPRGSGRQVHLQHLEKEFHKSAARAPAMSYFRDEGLWLPARLRRPYAPGLAGGVPGFPGNNDHHHRIKKGPLELPPLFDGYAIRPKMSGSSLSHAATKSVPVHLHRLRRPAAGSSNRR